MAACAVAQLCYANPCVDKYPEIAGEVLTSPAGKVKKIEPIEAWFEDGVYQITVESGGVIMVKPEGLPLPPIGSRLEMRVFSKSKTDMPMAGCYCLIGTDACLEEYTYP